MPAVYQGTVGQVPTFWIDSGRETLAASLAFRAGMVDETLSTRGWLHLIEHLALHDRGTGTLHVNGSVGLLTTRFDVHGPVAEVVEAMSGIARWLANPSFDRADHEAGVLRAEAELRQPGEVGPALLWRFGAGGPGLAGYDEFGLHHVERTDLANLAARFFTSANAALVLDGPPPAGLELPLGEGTRQPIPVARSCAQTLPLGYVIRSGVTMSGNLPRGDAATLVPLVLRELLHRKLREEAGGAYAPWGHYEAVDADRAIVLVGSDFAENLRPTVVSQLLWDVYQVSQGEGLSDLLDHVRSGFLQAMRDPYNAVGLAVRSALETLQGRPTTLTLAESLAGVEAVTIEEVKEHLATFRASMLMGIEGAATWPGTIPMATTPTRQLQHGRQFRLRADPSAADRLVVSDSAVQIGVESEARTIDFAALAAVIAAPDGGRQLIDTDGWTLTVEPTYWRNGATAVEELDARIPPSAYIHVPPRKEVPQPQLPSGGQRVRQWLSLPWVMDLLVFLVLVFFLVAAGSAGRYTSMVLVVGSGVFYVARRLQARR